MTDFSGLFRKTSGMLGEIAGAVGAVSRSVGQIAQKLDTQVKAVSEIGRTTQALADTAQDNARYVDTAVASASTSKEASLKGRASLMSAMEDMHRIHSQTGAAMQQIQSLDEKVQKIQSVTETISIIARQTNLLALNAAVEAARAGDHGRGFAVVADEVRKLASMTSESTREVTNIVEEIKEETQRVVSRMDELSKEVDQGSKDVEEVGSQLSGIADQASSLEQSISVFSVNNQNTLSQLHQVNATITEVRAGMASSEQEVGVMSGEVQRLAAISDETNNLLSSQGG